MFLGHYAVAMSVKSTAPALSLGTLFLSAQLADLLWPTFVLLGFEQVAIAPGVTAVTPLDFISYPFSHSLLALAVWGLVVAVLYRAIRGSPWAPAAALGLVVVSHWILDAISHRADMPIAFGDTRVGLGLWYSVPATLVVEGLFFAAGLALYVRSTRARNRIGAWAFWTLVVLLLVIYLANVFGPPPPSVAAVAWAGHGQWLLVAWAYFADRHRVPDVALPRFRGSEVP